ncbi:hypothetical protein J3456_19250, partial [Sulfitobacter sp. NFXS29]
MRFELGERHFDGVEVGTIGRQERIGIEIIQYVCNRGCKMPILAFSDLKKSFIYNELVCYSGALRPV